MFRHRYRHRMLDSRLIRSVSDTIPEILETTDSSDCHLTTDSERDRRGKVERTGDRWEEE